MNKQDDLADKKRNKLCKQLYSHLFGKKFPKGWHIYWHVQGFCSFHDQAIYLSADSLRDTFDLGTLVHEFVHLDNPHMLHGKKFTQLQRKLVREAKRALFAVRPIASRGQDSKGAKPRRRTNRAGAKKAVGV